MELSQKLKAGAAFPDLTVTKAGGGTIVLGGGRIWQLVVIYRGKHCPLCRKYLTILDDLFDDFCAIETDVIAISGDPKEKAESEMAEEGWRFPVGYDLTPDDMRRLGLYISEPRSPQETDRPFAEPGLFVINPEGKTHIVDISNAPFARPDLQGVLSGLKMIREKAYPIRGTAS